MVTKDKQWLTFKVLRLLVNYNGSNSSKYALNFKFPIITHLINGYYGQPMVTKGKKWWTFEVLGPSMIYNRFNSSKYTLNFKFPIITH